MSCPFPKTEHLLDPKSFLPTHRLGNKRGKGLYHRGGDTELHRQHSSISRSIATIHERFYSELAEVELKPREE